MIVQAAVSLVVKALAPAVKVLVRITVKVIVWVIALPVVKQVVKTLRNEERPQIRDTEIRTDNIMAEAIITMAEAVVVVLDAIHDVSQLVQVLVITHVVEPVTLVVVQVA